MQEERPASYGQLPKRKQSAILNTIGKKAKVTTNYFPIKIKSFKSIYIFKIVFTPHLEHDNRLKRESLLRQAMPSIKMQIENPIIGGMNIFSRSPPNKQEATHQVDGFKIFIKQVKCVDMEERANNKTFLHFINNGFGNIMKNLKFTEIGHTKKYIDQNKKKSLFDGQINVFSGFKTCVLVAEGGLFIRIDPTKKVVQNQTVLDYIDMVYQTYKSKERDQKRQIIKQALIGKIIMTNYGKARYLKIQDVQFKVLEQVVIPGKGINIIQYFKEKYQVNLKRTKNNSSQPLLRIENKNKNDPNPVYILPQICLMTGLPQHLLQSYKKFAKQQVSTPNTRHQQISNFIKNVEKNICQEFTSLQISIQKNAKEIQGYNLEPPTLNLGKQRKIPKGKQSQFNLFNQPLYDSKQKLKLGIICQRRQDFNQLKQSMKTTAEGLNLSFQVGFAQLAPARQQQTFIKNATQAVKIFKQNQKNCCLIVLPHKMKSIYPALKKKCLQLNMITQFVVESTLKNKNSRSIQTKILLQMAAKIGNTLWMTSCPKYLSGNTMIMSFDSTKVGNITKVTGVSTFDSDMTKLCCQSRNIESSHDKFNSMAIITNRLIQKYIKASRHFPKNIIVLVDSCPKNEVKMFFDYYIPQIRILQQANLTIIQVRGLSSQRFFCKSFDGTFKNPSSGLLIRDTIVTAQNDFYLIPQNPRVGTAVPIYFNIISSKYAIQEGIIEQLMYNQCFNYANWTGSIKIPAILQYTKKFCRFCKDVLGYENIENENLCGRPYFI